MKKKTKKILVTIICIVVIIAAVFGVLTSGSYKAQNPILINGETEYRTGNTIVRKCEDESIVFMPNEVKAGMIFYPGGNVEYTAYAPMMEKLADRGIMCVIVKMPFDLAVFDMNAADGIKERYPQTKKWYIGGHSLGGAMAGSYFEKNSDRFDGLILLAAYCTSDISSCGKTVISIYGSNDGVLNRDKYEEYKDNLPTDTAEYIIEGGCHSYFGNYGDQKGDGKPTITRDEQIDKTAEYIASTIF